MKIIYCLAGAVLFVVMAGFSSELQAKKFEEVSYEQTFEIKKGTTSNYISASGEKFSVGQEIILRAPANEAQNRYTYATTKDAPLVPPFPLSSAWNGTRIKIDKIWWKQVQKVPHVILYTSAEGANFGAAKQMIINLEAAIETGEVITRMEDMRPVAEKKPIEKLKEAKELLDLEVITQEEYDEIKARLMPLILGD
jgi:hypothetical protein